MSDKQVGCWLLFSFALRRLFYYSKMSLKSDVDGGDSVAHVDSKSDSDVDGGDFGLNDGVFDDPKIVEPDEPIPTPRPTPHPKGRKGKAKRATGDDVARPSAKRKARSKGMKPESEPAAATSSDSPLASTSVVAEGAPEEEPVSLGEGVPAVNSISASDPLSDERDVGSFSGVHPEGAVPKIDRRRGKITDPLKLAARREQLSKMREKALAARSANAKRKRDLKQAAKWKRAQEEEALLNEFRSAAADHSAGSLSTGASVKRSAAKNAQPHPTPKSDSSMSSAPPPAAAETVAERNVPPVAFGGYYTKGTGWNVNPFGYTPGSRYHGFGT